MIKNTLKIRGPRMHEYPRMHGFSRKKIVHSDVWDCNIIWKNKIDITMTKIVIKMGVIRFNAAERKLKMVKVEIKKFYCKNSAKSWPIFNRLLIKKEEGTMLTVKFRIQI